MFISTKYLCTKEEAEKAIKELKKFIEQAEEEEEKGREWAWKPESRQEVYTINEKGVIYEFMSWDGLAYSDAYEAGNMFQTQGQALKELEWRKARAKILRDVEEKNGGRKVDWNGLGRYKYEIYYNYDDETLKVYTTYEAQSLPAGMAYLNKKDAEASMKDLRNEWLIFFGVKEDK